VAAGCIINPEGLHTVHGLPVGDPLCTHIPAPFNNPPLDIILDRGEGGSTCALITCRAILVGPYAPGKVISYTKV